jgi:hypothetical protein
LIESRKSTTVPPQRRNARIDSDANQHPLVRFTRSANIAPKSFATRTISRMLVNRQTISRIPWLGVMSSR